MSELTLPPVYEAILDAEGLGALFRDLAALGTTIEIVLKHGAARHAEPARQVTLREAERMLESGDVRGLQLRYAHEEKLWCDTLIRAQAGTRLVRMELPTSAAQGR